MLKKARIIVTLILTLFIAGIVPAGYVLAEDSVNVTVSDAKATVGGEVEVTVSVVKPEGASFDISAVQLVLKYNPEALEFVSGSDMSAASGTLKIVSTEKTTFTVKFKALAAGVADVAVDGSLSKVSKPDITEATVNGGKGQISITAGVAASKVNTLKSLTVSPGELNPAFSKDVTTYNITLDKEVDKLTISAVPESDKAKVTIKGSKMDPGDNTTKIIVTAENGDEKVYVIYTKIPVTEKPTEVQEKELIIDVGGTLYTVIKTFDEKLLPEGYEITEYKYKDNKINVGKSLANGSIIFCVREAILSNDSKQFVILDQTTDTFTKLAVITTGGATYTVYDATVLNDVPLIPQNFVATTYNISGIDLPVFVNSNDANAEYFLVYCSNLQGQKNWYQYDTAEGTMQRAFINGFTVTDAELESAKNEIETAPSDEPVSNDSLKQEYDNYVKKTKFTITLMAFLLVALVVVMIAFAIKSFTDTHGDYEDAGDYEESDRYQDVVKRVNEKSIKREIEDFDRVNQQSRQNSQPSQKPVQQKSVQQKSVQQKSVPQQSKPVSQTQSVKKKSETPISGDTVTFILDDDEPAEPIERENVELSNTEYNLEISNIEAKLMENKRKQEVLKVLADKEEDDYEDNDYEPSEDDDDDEYYEEKAQRQRKKTKKKGFLKRMFEFEDLSDLDDDEYDDEDDDESDYDYDDED